jgi:hypothetical protein
MFRSRKFICVLFSCVGLNCRESWILFLYLCMSSAVIRVLSHIMRMSSMNRVYRIMFFVSSACFMCLFSICYRNISAMVPDIGDPMAMPLIGWYIVS